MLRANDRQRPPTAAVSPASVSLCAESCLSSAVNCCLLSSLHRSVVSVDSAPAIQRLGLILYILLQASYSCLPPPT